MSTKQKTVTVNENRLFSKVARYFGSPESALTEAIQNAYRASLPLAEGKPRPRIDIQIEGDDIIVQDNGRGIDDPIAMLSLANSDWEHDVEHDQDPAGLGVCGILAFCEEATWISKFGSLTVSSKQFFADQAYRDSLVTKIVPPQAESAPRGTSLRMHGFKKKMYFGNVEALTKYYHTADITIDGSPVEPADLGPAIGNLPGRHSVIHSNLRSGRFVSRSGTSSAQIRVIWHGHEILVPDFNPGEIWHVVDSYKLGYTGGYGGLHLTIDIRDENVVTPKLPDRTGLVFDVRTVAFLNESWSYAVGKYHQRLTELIRSEPEDVVAYKNRRREIPGVAGYAEAFKALTKFDLGITCRTRRDELRSGYTLGFKQAAVVVPKDDLKIYAPELTVVIAGDKFEEALVGWHPHNLLFDDGFEDPLQEDGFYQSRDKPAGFRLVLDAKEAKTVIGPEGTKRVLRGNPTPYMVPVQEYQSWKKAEPCTAAEFRSAFAKYRLDEIVDDVILTSSGIDNSDILESMVVISGDDRTGADPFVRAKDVLEEVHDSWCEYEYQDDEDARDEEYQNWRENWAELEAKWAGKQRMGIDMREVRRRIPGRPNVFTVNVDAETVTLPDGTIYAVSWG